MDSRKGKEEKRSPPPSRHESSDSYNPRYSPASSSYSRSPTPSPRRERHNYRSRSGERQRVSHSRPKEYSERPRPPARDYRRQKEEHRKEPAAKTDSKNHISLYCTNLPKIWTEKDAFAYFDKYVRVVGTRLMSSGERHDPRAMVVTVNSEQDAFYIVRELDGKKAKPTVRKQEKPDEQLVIRIIPRSQDFRLKVTKVPKSTPAEEVRSLFQFYGSLEKVEEAKSQAERIFYVIFKSPEMAHQAKSALKHNPYAMVEGEAPLEVIFERQKADAWIKKSDPKYYIAFPFNHSFQQKYLKSVYYAYEDEGKRYFFNPALGLTQWNRPSHHEFIVIDP